MEMQFNNIFLIVIISLFFSCKGEAQPTDIKHENNEIEKLEDSIIDFLNKKYDNAPYSLIIDESNISDHPIKSYLDCKNEGYFSIHFVPRSNELKSFWKDTVLSKYDFNDNNIAEIDREIREIVKNNLSDYIIFSYHITKNYLNPDKNCTLENVFANKNSISQVYLYDLEKNKWKLLKELQSNTLPPYFENIFFSSNFPELFHINKENSVVLHSFPLNSNLYEIRVYQNEDGKDDFEKRHFGLPIKIFKRIKDAKSILWSENNDLIFKSQITCISEGFDKVVTNSNYFTIEQQSCFDYNILVHSYTTFKMVGNEIYLHKYGETYFDKANHERKIPEKIWTSKDFGTIKFEDVTENILIQLRQIEPKK